MKATLCPMEGILRDLKEASLRGAPRLVEEQRMMNITLRIATDARKETNGAQ